MNKPRKCRSTGKLRYRSYEGALAALEEKLAKRDPDSPPPPLFIYFCGRCRDFHLTSWPQWRKGHKRRGRGKSKTVRRMP